MMYIPDVTSLNYSNATDIAEEALDLEREAQYYQEELNNQTILFGIAEQQAQNGTLLVNLSENLLNESDLAINILSGALLNLESTDTNILQEVRNSLEATELSLVNIAQWYMILNQSLFNQEQFRLQLQQNITEIQEQIDHLVYLHSILPEDCNSN